MLDRKIHNRLLSFSFLSDNQYGFCKGLSADDFSFPTALLAIFLANSVKLWRYPLTCQNLLNEFGTNLCFLSYVPSYYIPISVFLFPI